MSELSNEDPADCRALRPPAPAGHATDPAEPTSLAAGCFRGMEVAPRHIRRVLQTADGHTGRRGGCWVALTRWAAGIIFLIFGVAKFSDYAAELASFRHYPLPAPELFVYLVGVIEIGAGLLLIMGLLTRLAALALAVDMTGAIVISGLGRGELVSLTLAPLLLAAMISLIRLGPGPWSLDHRMARKATHGYGLNPGRTPYGPSPGRTTPIANRLPGDHSGQRAIARLPRSTASGRAWQASYMDWARRPSPSHPKIPGKGELRWNRQ
jgi:putative oxidoreductase